MLSKEKRDEWRKLAEAATAEPWVAWHPADVASSSWPGKAQIAGLPQPSVDKGSAFLRPDAAFIAAARSAVPALLDELDRLEAAIKKHHSQGKDDR